ncbi:hypothetical protein [Campylobacter hyointestinalis]|uniref:Lipoprotein n=1 Tax=Campylobacter hyointestinalis subsp. lawsonii TaxID=91353 RepID=A0AAV6EES1_CAMHY|nr:hypothetical protein [Campylobacter hyointestinalis]KAB0612762.1 hypothetical protein F7P66_05065 [Campylobacter hyointestinalis subsp. lawsonii]QKF69621.1 hypothetical protein CHLWT_1055 [Campylobacter hyointestinalis subsp. lawsonii]RAZ29412.1 hypothetical protein CHLT_01960 [Campylobacter hyointestinalis subsp. lawsonii]RAZ50362.1 hypothetical protein CHL9004_02565 [Campylobacter hyointestinalis subsp. lawsonii]
MKKLYILTFALLFSACTNQASTVKNTQILEQETSNLQTQNDEVSYDIEVGYMSIDEQNQKDIVLMYKDILSDVNLKAQTKDTQANLIGKTKISQKVFEKTAADIARYLRDIRKTDGKIYVQYDFDEKVLYSGKF